MAYWKYCHKLQRSVQQRPWLLILSLAVKRLLGSLSLVGNLEGGDRLLCEESEDSAFDEYGMIVEVSCNADC